MIVRVILSYNDTKSLAARLTNSVVGKRGSFIGEV